MKKLFLIFGFLITFALTSVAAFANSNYLHTITLERNNTGYNIILGSDKMAKVIKKSPSEREMVLELSGITSSDTVNALYKGTNNIDSLVVENIAPNKLNIYITADNINDSTIIMEPSNGCLLYTSDAADERSREDIVDYLCSCTICCNFQSFKRYFRRR